MSGNITPCLFVGTVNDPRCTPTTGIGAHTGSYAAELGNAGGDASLTQNLTTTPGATYELTFWLASQAYGTPANDFSVSWNNQTIYSAVNLNAFGYTLYDFTGLTTTSSSTALSFSFYNTPSYLVLDDISVVDPPGVPEPEPGLFSIAAFGMIIILSRGRRRRAEG